eukprot:TRINITY_DN4523_c0_g1_i4.p1 TRINITY_DN4523_c0_g1~~TRINITY_DN4523_c0_g1_i4.p1  ORF type:complete len:428 (-),score=45.91 TRINITY_DN4523_c0_g1_i4:61-1344(-)
MCIRDRSTQSTWGYLNVNPDLSQSSLYYLFVGKQGVTNASQLGSIPLVIWMNGGPGWSSLNGLFFENGPLGLQKNSQGNLEEYFKSMAWNKNYNLLYIDQPIGTGASYAQSQQEMCRTEAEVAQQWYTAVQQLTALSNCSFFTSYFQGTTNASPVFITGESYAGKYIPNIAANILQYNKLSVNPSSLKLNLKGIAYGNGFTDPVTIASEYGSYAYNLGLIDFNQRQQIEYYLLQLQFAKDNGNWQDATNIFNNAFSTMQAMAGGVFTYDMFEYSSPIPFDNLDEFMQTPSVAQGYNLNNQIVFDSNSDLVYQILGVDFMQDALEQITYCITQGIKVMIYQGQDDLIVPNPGTFKWVDQLTWDGSDVFNNLDFTFWQNSQGQPAGYYKRYQNNSIHMELRLVNKAGHLVPFYQPQNAMEMLDDFINSL